jgi:hypothetical protein
MPVKRPRRRHAHLTIPYQSNLRPNRGCVRPDQPCRLRSERRPAGERDPGRSGTGRVSATGRAGGRRARRGPGLVTEAHTVSIPRRDRISKPMPTWPHCSAAIPEPSRFCPACGAALTSSAQAATALGPVPPAEPRPASSAPRGFPPGHILADRYRIAGHLGRTGLSAQHLACPLASSYASEAGRSRRTRGRSAHAARPAPQLLTVHCALLTSDS